MSELLEVVGSALRDRYVLKREVGRGGMAIVFLARDRKLGRDVAIKVLAPGVASSVTAERFLREVRITAQLQHPNILPLIDSGEAAGLLYSVMPFVEGETLRTRLLSGPLPIPEALALACEMADALDYAHQRGIIHRDVKPENILISHGHAIVADFGIARAIGLAGGHSLTARGLPVGTAAYMSPEQALGNAKADARSDVYGTGCVLYEMLTGRMAFGGTNLKQVLERQASAEPTPAGELRPELPPAIAAIVARAMAKRPEDRYQTAGALANALRAAGAEPVRGSGPAAEADPPWPGPPEDGVPDSSRAGRWLVVGAAVVLLVLATTRLWPTRGGRQPPGGRPAAHAAYVNGKRWLEQRTPEGLRRAERAFGEALALDRGNARALAGLASVHTYSVIYGYRGEADPYTELAEALQLAGRAVARDSTAAEAYQARADARAIAFFPDDSFRADVLRARRLAPTSADVRVAYAWTLFRAQAFDSALAQAERALAQDPLAPRLRHALLALAIGARRYDVALREASPGSAAGADDPVTAVLVAYAQLLSGQPARCAEGVSAPWLAVRAMCLHELGRTREAAALTDSLAAELDQEHYQFLHQYSDLAAYYAWGGDAARSVRWLERAVAHSPMLHRWQLRSGLFDRVWNRAEFQQGLARAQALAADRLHARRAAIGD